MLPLIPCILSAAGSVIGFVSHWTYTQISGLRETVLSLENAVVREEPSFWSQLFEPLAKQCGGSLKTIALSACIASGSVMMMCIGTWYEMRLLRFSNAQRKDLEKRLESLREINLALAKDCEILTNEKKKLVEKENKLVQTSKIFHDKSSKISPLVDYRQPLTIKYIQKTE